MVCTFVYAFRKEELKTQRRVHHQILFVQLIIRPSLLASALRAGNRLGLIVHYKHRIAKHRKECRPDTPGIRKEAHTSLKAGRNALATTPVEITARRGSRGRH